MKTLRFVIFAFSIALVFVAIFAVQLGLDNDPGFGKGRLLLLEMGLLGGMIGGLVWRFEKTFTAALYRIRIGYQQNVSSSLQLWLLIVTIGVGTTYILTVQPYLQQENRYYPWLAERFKVGHADLGVTPSEKLLQLENPFDYQQRAEAVGDDFPWDASLYNGKFYLYWGPFPALMLLPLSSTILSRLTDAHLSMLFALGTLFYSASLLYSFWKRQDKPAPGWLLVFLIIVTSYSSSISILLCTPGIYVTAILGGQFFLIGGLFWSYQALLSKRKGIIWQLALASTHWGLALTTRVSTLPVIIFFLAMSVGFLLLLDKKMLTLKELLMLGLPIAIAGGGLALYNYARFDSVLEFGLKYQLTVVDYTRFTDLYSPGYMLKNLFIYLMHPLSISATFPFVGLTELTATNDRLAGLLYLSPFSLILLPIAALAKRASKTTSTPATNMLVSALAGSAAIATLLTLTFFFTTLRYTHEITLSISLLTAILLLDVYSSPAKNIFLRYALTTVILFIGTWTVLINLIISLT